MQCERTGKSTSEKIKSQSRKRQIRERIRYVLNCMFRYSQHLLEWLPCKNNRICFITLTRKGYVDNMGCIAQALTERNCGVEIVWITKYPETCNGQRDQGGLISYLKAFLPAVYRRNHHIRRFTVPWTDQAQKADLPQCVAWRDQL